jgi:hypothetical protein
MSSAHLLLGPSPAMPLSQVSPFSSQHACISPCCDSSGPSSVPIKLEPRYAHFESAMEPLCGRARAWRLSRPLSSYLSPLQRNPLAPSRRSHSVSVSLRHALLFVCCVRAQCAAVIYSLPTRTGLNCLSLGAAGSRVGQGESLRALAAAVSLVSALRRVFVLVWFGLVFIVLVCVSLSLSRGSSRSLRRCISEGPSRFQQ